jgi:hypothetical protein
MNYLFFYPIGKNIWDGVKVKPLEERMRLTFERKAELSLVVIGINDEYVPAVIRIVWSWFSEIYRELATKVKTGAELLC